MWIIRVFRCVWKKLHVDTMMQVAVGGGMIFLARLCRNWCFILLVAADLVHSEFYCGECNHGSCCSKTVQYVTSVAPSAHHTFARFVGVCNLVQSVAAHQRHCIPPSTIMHICRRCCCHCYVGSRLCHDLCHSIRKEWSVGLGGVGLLVYRRMVL